MAMLDQHVKQSESLDEVSSRIRRQLNRLEFALKFNGMQDGHLWLLRKYLSELTVRENVGSMCADIIPSMMAPPSQEKIVCHANNYYLKQKKWGPT